MPKVTMNELFKSFRGKIGDLVFREMPDGTIVVSRAPTYRKKRATKKQKAHRARMKEASKYGSWAGKVYPIYAELAEGTKRSPCSFAVQDWFKAPVIHRVEQKDGRILVEATDNIQVKQVRILIQGDESREGAVLEKGMAVKGEGDWWEFTPRTQGKTVVAEVSDLPGNTTRFVLS